MRKKFLSLLIAAVMVLAMVPATAMAADTSGTSGGIAWSFNDSTGMLTISAADDNDVEAGYSSGEMPNYNDSTDTASGSSTGNYPWASLVTSEITSIVITDGVTSIGSKAFIAYTSVESVSIGKDVTDIGVAAFSQLAACETIKVADENIYFENDSSGALLSADGTKLYVYPCGSTATSYTVAASVETIAYGAFSRAYNLETITIEDGSELETIGYGAFAFTTSLETIGTIPSSVETIGDLPFSGSSVYDICCADEDVQTLVKSLVSDGVNVRLESDDQAIKAEMNGYTYLLNSPSSGEATLLSAPTDQAIITIDETVTYGSYDYTVTSIGAGAFAVSTTWSTASSSATGQNTTLTKVTLPSTITSIGEKAFYFCTSLETVIFGETTEDITIGASAFATYAGNSTYDRSGDTSSSTTLDLSDISGSITATEDDWTGVCKVILNNEDQLDDLEACCVNGTEANVTGNDYTYWVMTSGEWESQNITAEDLTYTDANDITWTFSVDGEEATLTAYSTKDTATSVTVPSEVSYKDVTYTVTTLGTGLFGTSEAWNAEDRGDNTVLEEVTVPATVTEIQSDVFRYCTNLKQVTFEGTKLTFGSRVFSAAKVELVIDMSAATSIACTDTADYQLNLPNNTIVYVSSSELQTIVASCANNANVIFAVTNEGIITNTKSVDGTTGLYNSLILDGEGEVFEGWYTDSTLDNKATGTAEAGYVYYANYVPSDYSLSPDTISLGKITYGSTTSGYVTVSFDGSNGGTAAESYVIGVTTSDNFKFVLSGDNDEIVTITSVSNLEVDEYEETIVITTADGATHNVTVTLEVTQASPELTLSATSGTYNIDVYDEFTFTYTYSGDGDITVDIDDTYVATCVYSDGTVTVTLVGTGSATITVSVAESDNYTKDSATYILTVTENTTTSSSSSSSHSSYSLSQTTGSSSSSSSSSTDDEDSSSSSGTVSAVFTDLSTDHPYYDAIMTAYENGWMVGTSGTTFEPDAPLTRAMAAKILHNIAGNPDPEDVAPFHDVLSGEWYSEAVAWAYEQGIVVGYDAQTFGPDDYVTTEQFNIMLANLLGQVVPDYVGGAPNATRGWIAYMITA